MFLKYFYELQLEVDSMKAQRHTLYLILASHGEMNSVSIRSVMNNIIINNEYFNRDTFTIHT